MSLILDALKKSEQERRRGRGPDLQSLHQAPVAAAARRPWLPWAGLALLVVAVNGAALAWWLNRPADAIPAMQRQPDVAVAPEPVAGAATPAAVANAAVSSPAPAPAAPVPATPPPPAVPPAQPPLQELWELPEGVRRQLPALTYSFHVYAGDPSRRTIIINNRRMREGSEIQPGLLLEEITADGVILATGDHRVHVSVLENW